MLVHGDNLSMFPPHVTRVYGLVLNMMRDRMERADLVACSDSLEELKQFEAGERVDEYVDGGFSGFDGGSQKFRKVYRKGGPLEWYNPPDSMDRADPDFGHGVIVLEMQPRWTRVA